MITRRLNALPRIPADLLLQRALLATALLAGVVAISPNVADPDLWGHVQYGRDLLANGLPTHTTYSYVAADQPWINHENLMEVALAWGADWLGPIGLVVAKMLLGMALLLALIWQCRKQQAGLLATSIVVLLTAGGVAHYWSLRPQLFSFAAYALLLSLLAWCFEGWEGRWRITVRGDVDGLNQSEVLSHRRLVWLWLIVPLMVAWTNAHGGFLAGGAIFIAYLLMRSLEIVSHGGPRVRGLLKRFGLMIVATVAATFVNPYGYQYHFWLFDDLHVPRPEITEWLPPSWSDPQTLPLSLLIGLLAFAVMRSRRSWDATHLVILAATLWQSLEHQRHIPFFALSVAFFVPRHVESALAALSRKRSDDEQPTGRIARRFAVGGLAFSLLMVGFKLYERASDLKVPRDHYPVSAVQFMADEGLKGRVLCTFNWAQYLLGVFPHDVQVHVDGRCRTAFSQELLDEHFDFLFGEQPQGQRYRSLNSRFDPLRALARGTPNLVLIDRGQPHSVATMQSQSSKWVLLYQDSLAQLWGKRDRYDDLQSPEYLPQHHRQISEEPQTGHVTWPAAPQAMRGV